MDRKPVLLDRWGRPIQRAALTKEVAAPTLGGVRSPLSGYPADGLDPTRLAAILRDADQGDATSYLELAETIEERDPHYLGVLGTRRRSVSQLDITVEAASDDPRDEEQAKMVREWLDRDELADELFDILDCVGKGFSITEIIWDVSEGQWRPERLERRDPRWFRFDRADLSTPRLIGEGGQDEPLQPFKFIFAQIKAKSGLPLRSGVARVAAWAWMFKAYTQRDWAIFTQTYGQPVRLGKYGTGASEADKETLFRAVANIAGDCAAIIPDTMEVEFVETGNVGASSDLYERRADWLDRQVSKAILGQTTSTDAVAGGHAVSKEHRLVQEDIERADGRALAAILNRDLIRPWIELEYGPQKRYPRLRIVREEPEDLALLAETLSKLVPLGLRVSMADVRDRVGLPEPAETEEILTGAPPSGPSAGPEGEAPGRAFDFKRQNGDFKRDAAEEGVETLNREEAAPGASQAASAPEALLAAQLEREAGPAIDEMVAAVERMVDAAGSMEELREMMQAAWPELPGDRLHQAMAVAMLAAHAAGRVEVMDEDG